MLQPAKREVPSLELGPPSPSWTDLIVGSPPGGLKPASRSEAPASPSPRCQTTKIQLLTAQPVVDHSEARVQESAQTRDATVVATSESLAKNSASLSGPAAICESRKRSKSPSCLKSSSQRYAKRRRVVPSGEKSTTNELEKWSSTLSADALSEAFIAPSAMDLEREATEEFMNEFWGDLMLGASPISNDSLIAAASPFEDLHLPQSPLTAAQPDADLLDSVTEAQLLELTQFLEPGLTEAAAPAPTAAPAPVDLLPPPPAEAPATAKGSVVAPIDLAALLEETEIVFSPPLAQPPSVEPSPPAPAPTPAPAPAPAAEPTHYLLVVSPAEQEPAPPSVASDSTDDPSARWSSTSTEPEEVVEEVKTAGATRKRAARRPAPATPAEKYRRIRDNNNEASRRSRQQRKQREADTQTRAEELQKENTRLRQKVDVLESLLEQVKALAPLLTARQ